MSEHIGRTIPLPGRSAGDSSFAATTVGTVSSIPAPVGVIATELQAMLSRLKNERRNNQPSSSSSDAWQHFEVYMKASLGGIGYLLGFGCC